MNALQAYVVDDDADVRKGLTSLLESAGYPARGFPSATSFLDAVRANIASLAGCLVLDLRMPEMDGLALQRRLVEAGNAMPILFLTGHGEVPDAVVALRAGAVDFLLKPVDGQRLLARMEQIWQDETERIRLAALQFEVKNGLCRLSSRERQVLALALDGLQNPAIAASLNMSGRTVEAHRSRLLLKLGAPSLQVWRQRCDIAGLTRQALIAELSADLSQPLPKRD